MKSLDKIESNIGNILHEADADMQISEMNKHSYLKLDMLFEAFQTRDCFTNKESGMILFFILLEI